MSIAIVVFSFLAFAFSSFVMMPGMKEPLFGHRDVPMQRYVYEAPERKAIIVDNDGISHPTADLTHSTKRDRSRKLETEKTAAPSLNIVSGEVSAAVTQQEAGTQTLLFQGPAPAADRESAIMMDLTKEMK